VLEARDSGRIIIVCSAAGTIPIAGPPC
jgi:hypothetical protein